LTPDKIGPSSGRRYIRARRTELMADLIKPLSEDERAKSSGAFADVWWKKNRDD
jgi:hypothetical protein